MVFYFDLLDRRWWFHRWWTKQCPSVHNAPCYLLIWFWTFMYLRYMKLVFTSNPRTQLVIRIQTDVKRGLIMVWCGPGNLFVMHGTTRCRNYKKHPFPNITSALSNWTALWFTWTMATFSEFVPASDTLLSFPWLWCKENTSNLSIIKSQILSSNSWKSI